MVSSSWRNIKKIRYVRWIDRHNQVSIWLETNCRRHIYIYSFRLFVEGNLSTWTNRSTSDKSLTYDQDYRRCVAKTLQTFTVSQFLIVLWFYFGFLRLVCPILSVSLDCPFVIALSVFSSVFIIYGSKN